MQQEQLSAYLAHVPVFHVPSYTLTAVLDPLTSGQEMTSLLMLAGACVVGADVTGAVGIGVVFLLDLVFSAVAVMLVLRSLV
jgi:hypothetical protein